MTRKTRRIWDRAGRERRADREVIEKLERLILRSPRPRASESLGRWMGRRAKFERAFRAFLKQNAGRLERLGIPVSEIGLLDAKTVPLEYDFEDPRYIAAEEKEVLEKLAKKGFSYDQLG